MRKLIAALALCAGTAAFAADAEKKAQEPASARPENSSGARVSTGVDATEVGPGIERTVKDTAQSVGLATEDQGTFTASKAYDIWGTLKNTGGGSVTVERKGLPPASLDVRDRTVVTLDGKRVSAKDLPEGAQVRAKFQIEGEEVVGLKLDATSPSAKTKSKSAKD